MRLEEILMEGYSGYLLDDESRSNLAQNFPPKYPEFIGHHATEEFPANSAPEAPSSVEVVGYADDGEGLEALVIAIDGRTERPDGSTYHITWSLDRSKGRKPFHSNNLVKSQDWEKVNPININVIPKLFERKG